MPTGVSLALPRPVAPASDRVRTRVGTQASATALVVTSGVLYTLAQPPLDLEYLAWICLVPVLGAIGTCRTWRGGALSGLAFAMVFSALEARWLPGAIGAFFGVSPVLGWLGAGAVYLTFAGAPYALFGALAHGPLRARRAVALLAGVPALVVVTELVRAHLLGGLPWGLLGHGLYRSTTFIQVADVAGIYGVSFAIALVNVALVGAWWRRRAGRAVLAPLAVALAAVAALWLYGRARLATEAVAPGAAAVRVGVLQPNQAPVYHATQVAGDRALLAHARLSRQHFGLGTVDLVVWPENAVPFYLARDRRAESSLRRLAVALGAPLIVGAPDASEGEQRRFFNAAHLITPEAGVAGVYRKQRLVPFAEYWPLGGGAAAQQLAQTVFRAVENRRDVVRATTTGISAVVDAQGVVRAVLDEHRAGAFLVPVHARRALTVYTRCGDAFAACCLLLLVAVLPRRWKR